ncbi:hypothetical protein [uncultured Sphingomonas sp.]|uniref:hypothetical protein n=1 Tax=uncultured Sphingomonas sp. TaxID=158754 RepID=UPI0025FB466F|nr:hypothetical protein [uncultured Sphingomonas sp.]
MRRRFASVPSPQTAPEMGIADGRMEEGWTGNLKLFGLTYAAGFLFVSLLIV